MYNQSPHTPLGVTWPVFFQKHITLDKGIYISISYRIIFLSIPSPTSTSPSFFRDPTSYRIFKPEADSLLQLGAIEPIPPKHSGKGIYSKYFQIPQKKGCWRPILDLKELNVFICHSRFRMTSIIPSLNEWFDMIWRMPVSRKLFTQCTGDSSTLWWAKSTSNTESSAYWMPQLSLQRFWLW